METLLNARAEVTDAALAAIAYMPTASLPVLMDDAFAQRLTDADLMRIDSIGVISDTHGLLRPEALTMLEGCGLILHLGDVGARDEDAALLERLAELACACTPSRRQGARCTCRTYDRPLSAS